MGSGGRVERRDREKVKGKWEGKSQTLGIEYRGGAGERRLMERQWEDASEDE